MTVTVNGTSLDLETGDTSVGETLAVVDDIVEKAGSVILGIALDGTSVDADALADLSDRRSSDYKRLEIDSVPAFELRSRAYGALLDFLKILRSWTGGSDSGASIQEAWASYGALYSGLLSAEEHSFLDLLDQNVQTLAAAPQSVDRQKFSRHADRLEPIFRERLEEILDPAASMRSTSLLYSSERENLLDVPVRMQTGKDAEAMRSILLFVEIFNKANRILPELARVGVDTPTLLIDGLTLPDFYKSFNEVLRQLMGAFENKDAVLIGDLAEYEIVPRMNSFFDAVVGALVK